MIETDHPIYVKLTMGYLKFERSDLSGSTYKINITQRCARILRLLMFFFILLTGLLGDYPAFSAPLKGYGKIIDGDSLVVNGKSIRLVGIDAPQGVQWCHDAKGIDYRCGVMATAWMISAISTRQVRCDWTEKDRYKRLLGRGFQPECGKCECGMVSSLSSIFFGIR